MKYRVKVLDGINKYTIDEEFKDDLDCLRCMENRNLKVLNIKKYRNESKLEFYSLFNRKLELSWMSNFIRQFSILLSSGITVIDALDVLASQNETKYHTKIIQSLKSEIEAGSDLSSSMRSCKVFPESVVMIIVIGESTGKLDYCMNLLANYLEEESKLKKDIKNSLIYPSILFITTIIVIFFLVVKVFPTYTNMFSSSGVELPRLTQNIILVSEFISSNFIYLAISVILLIVFIKILSGKDKVKLVINKLILYFPIIGKYEQMIIVTRFSKILTLNLNSGIDLLSSMEIISETMSNYYIKKEIMNSIEYIKSGETIYNSLKQIKIFPNILLSMINIGEKTGKLQDTMELISNYYSEELKSYSKKFVAVFEPIVIIVLGIFVAYIVMGIALPTFEMIDMV